MESSYFFDLPVEERGPLMELACERSGVQDFFDLPAEERAAVYAQADDGYYD